MTINDFFNEYQGKSIDYDGVSGVQCVDLIKIYADKVLGLKFGAFGNAKDYYLNFEKIKMLKDNFEKIPNTPEFVPKKGDICVFNSSNINKYGHVCIATGEGDRRFFKSLDMNWGGKEAKIVLHSYNYFLGVLRPKKLATENSLFWVRVDKEKACVRSEPNTKTGKLQGSKYLYKGNTFQAKGTVIGENVSGNSIWYESWKGNFVWSGGLTRI